MPIITAIPSTDAMEAALLPKMPVLCERVKDIIHGETGHPRKDILVHLAKCPYRWVDPDAAQVVLQIDSSPDEKLEEPCDSWTVALAHLLAEMGFTEEGAEVWTRFFIGSSWVLIKGTTIIETAPYHAAPPTEPPG